MNDLMVTTLLYFLCWMRDSSCLDQTLSTHSFELDHGRLDPQFRLVQPSNKIIRSIVLLSFTLLLVLDAAALPYTLVESKKPPFLQNEIRRRVHSLSKPPAPKDPEAPPLPEEDLPFDKGILCIGRAAWRETLLGLQDGMCSPPLTAEEERIEKEWWAWKEKGDRNDGFNKDPEPIRPSRLPVAEANAAKAPEIPPIGFVPYRNNPGFVRFPTRLYYFFNRRDLAREYGEATLAVCFGQSRPFTQTDEYKGWEVEEFRRPKTKEWENTDREIGILEGVQRRLRVFDLEGSNGAVGARKE